MSRTYARATDPHGMRASVGSRAKLRRRSTVPHCRLNRAPGSGCTGAGTPHLPAHGTRLGRARPVGVPARAPACRARMAHAARCASTARPTGSPAFASQCAAWVFRPLLDYATAAHEAGQSAAAPAALAPGSPTEEAQPSGEVVALGAPPRPAGIPAAFLARLHELEGSVGGVGLKLRGRRGVEAALLLRQLYWEGMLE
jgi:hypothetical protein